MTSEKTGKTLAPMNKELISRRNFFRKAASKVVPLLGVLICTPILSIAQDTVATSCKNTCKASCNNTCLGCCYQSPCKGGCKMTCHMTCKYTGKCDACSDICKGTCRGSCHNTCKYKVSGVNENDTIFKW